MWIPLRDRRVALGASVALFVCALTWSSEGLASCGRHVGVPGEQMANALAHFEYSVVLFGADSVQGMSPSAALSGLSCPGRGQSEMPSSVPSTPVRTEPWVDGPSSSAPDPSSRPLIWNENRRRPQLARAPIDRPPRSVAVV